MRRSIDHRSVTEILVEYGARIRQARLNQNLLLEDVAYEANISKSTLAAIENGKGSALKNYLSVLFVLKIVDGIDIFIPEQKQSPISLYKREGEKRQRASKKKKG